MTKKPRYIVIVLVLSLCGCTAAMPRPERFSVKMDHVKNSVTDVVVTNESGSAQRNVPVTFALPFVVGDVPTGASLVARLPDGTMLPTQLDRKAAHPDGSLRHGIITVVLPKLKGGQSETLVLARVPAPPAKPARIADLPAEFNAAVRASVNGSTYSTSVRELLKAGHAKTWLAGPLVTAWIVDGPLKDAKGNVNPYLAAQFAIRYYPGEGSVRVSITVENDWTYVPKPHAFIYNVQLLVGSRQVYAKDHLVQYPQTRWRKVFWWGAQPETYVQFNLAYLKATHTIPNYDPNLEVPSSALAHMAEELAASNTGPGGVGFVDKHMPATGGRGDIGPLPRWTALYLLSMDRRAWLATKKIADLSGSWPIHYRDRTTGLPLSLARHPRASAHPLLKGKHKYSVPKIHWLKRVPKSNLKPNAAHEPSFAFVPYLLTGDYYYLEELQFWAVYNCLETSPSYRGFGKGLLKWTQVRAQAWSLRTLAQTAYITPDDHPMKAYWVNQLNNNLEYYDEAYARNPDANRLHILVHREPYNHGRGIAPWQNDFFTWAIGYVAQLGYQKADPMWRWQAQFPVSRMIAPGYCYVYATIYQLNIRDERGKPIYDSLAKAYDESVPARIRDDECGSAAMARALGQRYRPGDLYGYPWSPQGYPANLQPALASAVDAGIPGAAAAWKLFMKRPTKPNYSAYPNWDIVPRKSEAAANSSAAGEQNRLRPFRRNSAGGFPGRANGRDWETVPGIRHETG